MPETAPAKPYFLDPRKFRDPAVTADGEPRARVRLNRLEMLWFNTGTLCNLTCRNCYIESSPSNDRLVYLTLNDVRGYLDEIERDGLGTRALGYTGGEPFLNPAMPDILEESLDRGYEVLVLTNAMRPMMRPRVRERLRALDSEARSRVVMRVSLDHYSRDLHEAERGPDTFAPAMEGLHWLTREGFRVDIAGRLFSGESEAAMREGYARLFRREGIALDAHDPHAVVLFPEMDARLDVPEITEACWGKLGLSPDGVMCASSRMVVKRKDAPRPSVVACTLLPYDPRFELGHTLAEAAGSVALNHPHCARFCVLGGASCSG
ncbi:radical SAM protein [Spiribacter halobius]|uniref:Radical SAM protein n=1 Tax=Sediminicurvatus halobius TaxID=2182432 RepID=A0A2U2N9L9_9GAMM|nr:radical SAM protein [Spiribacter halobius]PWG65760.1 radical SAM protein [Spiribacter halobius]UEX77797.1 radical SAM protein [Spiribacter halobius]